MKSVLVLVKRLAPTPARRWLVDELIEAMGRRGIRVTVAVFQLDGAWAEGSHEISPNVTAHVFPVLEAGDKTSVLKKYWRFAARWLVARRKLSRVLRESTFDCVINFSILSMFAGVPSRVRRHCPSARVVSIIWDFFPIHQRQIGKLRPAFLEKALYRLERREVMASDHVAMMSERNVEFFSHYFPGYPGSTFILPVWGRAPSGDSESMHAQTERSSETFRVVFGGQLEPGRGIEQILSVAKRCRDRLASVRFIIIGRGSLAGFVASTIERQSLENLELRDHVDRDEYRRLLSGCDAGLVITVGDVTVPTFPSKVIDYMLARLPVIACVEASTDFGEFVESVAKCGLHVPAGDDEKLVQAIAALQTLRNENRLHDLGNNGYRYFQRHMEVGVVAERLIATTMPATCDDLSAGQPDGH